MLPQYKLVLVSIISSLILGAVLLFVRFILKKKIPPLALIILISIPPIVSILRPGVYESGDFNLHLYRSIDFFTNLREGNLMPSWGGMLNMTFGYPVFVFNYILQYYIIALFHLIGLSFINSMKIFLILSFVSSGIFMYLWTRKIFKNDLQALTAAIFYLFTPYHLVVLHFRVNGEILAFAFIPLILFFVQRILNKPNIPDTLITGILYGLFYLAHSASAVFFLPVLLLYSTLTAFHQNRKPLTKILHVFSASLIGIVLASYVFTAHIVLSQFTYSSLIKSGVVYYDFMELVYAPWRLGFLFQGPKGELSFLVGYTQLFVVLGSLYLLAKEKIKKQDRSFVLFWLVLFAILCFMITPWSDMLWKTIPLLSVAQFSYRLLLLVTLCVSMLAGYFVINIKNKNLAYLLLLLTIGYTILNWGNRGTVPKTDQQLTSFVPYSSLNYEAMAIMASPKWLRSDNLWEKSVPKKHIEVVKGKAEVKEVSRKTTVHTYIISADTSVVLKENTLYFPGWQVKVDNKQVPVTYIDQKHLGKILFNVPKGSHRIEVSYDDIPIYKLSKQISVGGYILTIGSLGLFYYRKKFKK
ncbi:glycosyltransferase family 39 protein [Patescibacteria group bacterium]|nr:glycosyltransferase family 39 protein [Patescibacteria group bacterium]